jgi:apolipoprotein N-acyltransferase
LDRTRGALRYYNSAYLVAPSGDILADYDKQQLLPFAEYRPFGLSALLPHSDETPSEFSPGVRSTVFPFPPAPFGAVICYEATYPALTRQLTHAGARFLVNISNDAWLTAAGNAAAAQHFSMAVLRAVENRRPLVRLAASGESGFITASGQIQQRAMLAEGVLLGQVVPHTEQTVYTRYGDWFATCCVGLAGVSLGSLGRRSRGILS